MKTIIIIYTVFWSCMLAFLTACVPNIIALNPDSGPQRTLVEIRGGNENSSVYWDAGTASEQIIPSGYQGAYLFTVPVGASLGIHQVQLKRSGDAGNMKPFDVTVAQPFGAPRLDRVSISSVDFQPGNNVNPWLYVQGANVDAGAEVLVNGTVVPTVAHKGIRNNLFGVTPQSLNYPIYHYLALLASPGPQPAGSIINVSIRNLDGLTSNIISYTLPVDAATLDSDGDDFPDVWEENGYDADGDGTIDVDLPALGADPHRPDIFVEVDVMNGLNNPPGAAVWTAVAAAFANAPIINPGDDNGINIVIDSSGTVPFWPAIDLEDPDNPPNYANFYTLKAANFNNPVRGRIYHYCIWANARPGGSSGISDVAINAAGTDFGGPGDDFIVSFDDFPLSYQTVRSMAATFMHELGHNLQQRHGGVNHFARNPTYSSVMSYSWQLRTGQSNATRCDRPIYAPFYYRANAIVENNCAVPIIGVISVLPDFSSGMGRNLAENNLNEPNGLYNNNAIDWNQDGDSTDISVASDLTGDNDTNDTLVDFDNWSNLVYSGPRQNGRFGN